MMLGRSRLPEAGRLRLHFFGPGFAGVVVVVALACVSFLLTAPSCARAEELPGGQLPLTLPFGLNHAQVARGVAYHSSITPPIGKPGDNLIVKWAPGPIRVRFVDQELKEFDRNRFPPNNIVQFIHKIRTTFNIDIDISDGPDADIHFIFVVGNDLRDFRKNRVKHDKYYSSMPYKAKRYKNKNLMHMKVLDHHCSGKAVVTENYDIVGAVIFYFLYNINNTDGNRTPMYGENCLLGALGVRRGEFSPLYSYSGRYHGVLIRLLYDEQVRAGMTMEDAAEIMEGILDHISPEE